MPSISRARALTYAALVVVALVLGGKLLLGSGGASEGSDDGGSAFAALVADSGGAATSAGAGLQEEAGAGAELLVHVAGAVRRPGLYRLREGSRVDDAIRRAGGPRPKAALDMVNLAAPVGDGQQVLVPLRTGARTAVSSGAGAASGAAAAGPVSLNSASLEDLDGLPGVGPVTAQKIVDYRTEHGAFRSVEELDAVPGIGPARMAELRDLVTL